jgi:hypothetical protein
MGYIVGAKCFHRSLPWIKQRFPCVSYFHMFVLYRIRRCFIQISSKSGFITKATKIAHLSLHCGDSDGSVISGFDRHFVKAGWLSHQGKLDTQK